MKKLLLILSFIIVSCDINTYDDYLNESEDNRFEIVISDENFSILKSNKALNKYYPAKFIYKGEVHKGEIRAAGAGSRLFPKLSFRVKLTDGSQINNSTTFNLSAQVYDYSMLHSLLAEYLYSEAGFETVTVEPFYVYVNGNFFGLYPMLEIINEDFFNERKVKLHELFKVEFDSKFSMKFEDYLEETFEKKYPENDDFRSLYELVLALDSVKAETVPQTIGKYLDIDQYLKYHALTTIINNVDAFTNNFYLFKREMNSPFEVVPWDFDKAFTYELDELEFYGDNDIIKKLLINENIFEKYKKELEYQIENLFIEEKLFPLIDNYAGVIKEGYNRDPYLGNGRFNFEEQIEELKSFIKQRRNFYKENLQFFNINNLAP